MPVEGVVNALHRIHQALRPGALVIDTQPVSTQPPVLADGLHLGEVDMSEWGEIAAAVSERVDRTVAEGLFADAGEERFVVVDSFESGPQVSEVVSGWNGALIGEPLGRRLAEHRGPAAVHQQVRMRLLRAR